MLRASLRVRVHLFSAVVPHAKLFNGGAPLTAKELEVARTTLAEWDDLLHRSGLRDAVGSLLNLDTLPKRRALIRAMGESMDVLRGELYKKTCVDVYQRVQIHEAIMAAGFYQRAIDTNVLKGESVRFVLNHYNFDVRRDVIITKAVHDALLAKKEVTSGSDKLIRDILLLERRLFGKYRFGSTGGRHWLMLSMALSDIKTKAEIERLMSLPSIKEEGNFSLTVDGAEKLWETLTLIPKEESEISFLETADLHKLVNTAELSYKLRVQKPLKPISFSDRFKEALLHYWVIWFSLWIMFFMVDEEIITLVALIFMKHQQTQRLHEEAKKTKGKVYVASSTGSFG
ncbi:unnamed protein product [Phytomonas sp. Hart1]|nr:unnamed protein product [Phytomonas sp. Hart1]|eukprot:CCW68938.1 unnamed protein product [Phytomonas sp. isolate Hart1]